MTTLAVLNPEIREVMDLQTGQHHSLCTVVGSDRGHVIQLRRVLKIGQKLNKPLYACSECGVPVNLLMHPESRLFYFKHTLEDGRCSAVTRGQLSQKEIDARKYNGAKESARHINMKKLVAESLGADPRFSDVKIEQRWKGKLTGDWRTPDVCATYCSEDGAESIKVVFEIQLSTTYLDVVAERHLFYLAEGGLLFWIFAEFNDIGRRLTQDDVFYNNNQNAFLVCDETTAASIALGRFQLTCVWAEPTSSTAASALQRKVVSFHELTLNQASQQAFYYDFYGKKEVIQQMELAKDVWLRENFEKAWLAWTSGEADIDKEWGKFYQQFKVIGVPLPFYPHQLHQILVNALYSAKHGRVIGWRYTHFVEVAHRIATGHKSYLLLFRHALQVYGRAKQIESEDKSGKWRARVAQYKTSIRAGDSSYAPDTTHYEVLAFLFPELFTSHSDN